MSLQLFQFVYEQWEFRMTFNEKEFKFLIFIYSEIPVA